jgi:hypothetical protein
LAQTVQRGKLLDPDDLLDVDCRHLKWARVGMWARHAYRFAWAEARSYFAANSEYKPRVSRSVAEDDFSDADWSNLKLLNGTMVRAGCDCPKGGRAAAAPCPE